MELTAMVYIMDETRKAQMPSIHYYDVLYQGYQAFGFDLAQLKQGIADSLGTEYADVMEIEHRRTMEYEICE